MEKRIKDGIEQLKSGDVGELRIVYSAFATNDTELIRCAGEAVTHSLRGLQRTRLLRLCERFRQFTSLEWCIDWADVSLDKVEESLSEEAYRYVLILGSFHPNGYFREKCMYKMAGYDGMLFWLFFRVNDWVWDIRTAACGILEVYLREADAQELFEGIPGFERLLACRRRTEDQMQKLGAQIEKRISLALRETDIRAIPRMEPAVRRALYRVLVQAGLFVPGEMDALLQQEKIPHLKRILLKGILAQPDCTPEWAERYLTDSSAVVRRMAVEFRYEHLKTCWQGLEEMLLDSSRGVREYAAYILGRHGSLDIRRYYLAHIGDDKPENAIMGLSENSRCGNIQEFMTCMERPERTILKCALLALGRQEDFVDGELLWHYLLDDRADLSKAAYVSIRKRDFHFGAERLYCAYMETEGEQRKGYLLNLLLRESSWSRLPYLVRIYRRDASGKDWDRVLSGIQGRFMYGRISQSLHQDILLALEENGRELPEGVEEKILYDMKFLLR